MSIIYEVSSNRESSCNHILINVQGDEVETALRKFPEISLCKREGARVEKALLYVAIVSNEERVKAESEMVSDTEAYAIRVLFVRGLIVEAELQPRVATISLPENISAEAALMSVLSSFLGYSEICNDFYDFFVFYKAGFGKLNIYPLNSCRGLAEKPASNKLIWITVFAHNSMTLHEFDDAVEKTCTSFSTDTIYRATTSPSFSSESMVVVCEISHFQSGL